MYSPNLLALCFICDIWGQSGASCLSWFALNKDLSVSALQFWLTANNESGRVPPPLVLPALAGAGTHPPPSHLQGNRKAVHWLYPWQIRAVFYMSVKQTETQLWENAAVSKWRFVQLEELFERNITVLVSAGFVILYLVCLPCSFQSGWRWHGWAKPAQLSSHPLSMWSSLQLMVKPIPVVHCLPDGTWPVTTRPLNWGTVQLLFDDMKHWSTDKKRGIFECSHSPYQKSQKAKDKNWDFFFAVLICASLSGTHKLLIFTLHWCDPALFFFFLTGPLPFAGHMKNDVCWIITIALVTLGHYLLYSSQILHSEIIINFLIG